MKGHYGGTVATSSLLLGYVRTSRKKKRWNRQGRNSRRQRQGLSQKAARVQPNQVCGPEAVEQFGPRTGWTYSVIQNPRRRGDVASASTVSTVSNKVR